MDQIWESYVAKTSLREPETDSLREPTHLGNRWPHLGNREWLGLGGVGWGGWATITLERLWTPQFTQEPHTFDVKPQTKHQHVTNLQIAWGWVDGVGWGGWAAITFQRIWTPFMMRGWSKPFCGSRSETTHGSGSELKHGSRSEVPTILCWVRCFVGL